MDATTIRSKLVSIFVIILTNNFCILEHHNIKVFVTQGGVHSIEESLENGIPMLGLPFFVDQPQNVKKLILEGIGLGANLKTDSVDHIKRQIIELIENNKYDHVLSICTLRN